ncbi:MAG: hypothetical protein R6V40_04515, partial [Candidatus Moraniibacteriota bacterium]
IIPRFSGRSTARQTGQLILNKNSLFGTELKDYLNSLDINKITEDNKIKLIFQFEEGKNKPWNHDFAR